MAHGLQRKRDRAGEREGGGNGVVVGGGGDASVMAGDINNTTQHSTTHTCLRNVMLCNEQGSRHLRSARGPRGTSAMSGMLPRQRHSIDACCPIGRPP